MSQVCVVVVRSSAIGGQKRIAFAHPLREKEREGGVISPRLDLFQTWAGPSFEESTVNVGLVDVEQCFVRTWEKGDGRKNGRK